MPKFILSIILLVLTLQTARAASITVGFENLQSVCGDNFDHCNATSLQPYQHLGLTFSGGTIMRQVYRDAAGTQSIFPFGSYYLNIGETYNESVWTFTDPWGGNAPRRVTSVEFLVLGKQGDIISGPTQRPGTSGTSSVIPDERPGSRTCVNQWECPGWLSGLTVEAMDGSSVKLDAVVHPVYFGEAGYASGPADFANFRVVLQVAPDQAFSSIKFTPSLTKNHLGHDAWGMIAIDQVTFEYAVPEPGTFVLGSVALLGFAAWRRRRQAVND